MRRTKEQAAETRRNILNMAEALFLERSYESVSLDEIATAASVTRGAVYWHFQNKQGLLLAIRDEMPLPMRELALRLADDTTIEPLSALGEAIAITFANLQADPRWRSILRDLVRVDFEASGETANIGNVFQRQLRSSLTQIFEAAQRSGALQSPWTPKSAAIVFNATLNGLINEWARGQSDFELIPDAAAIVKAILDGWAKAVKTLPSMTPPKMERM